MERGIFRHGFFKTFLTRGLFRGIFKPLLYTKADHIHWDFVDVLTDLLLAMDKRLGWDRWQMPNPFMFWLVIVPKQIFEVVFIEDENGRTYLDVVQNATLLNGKKCAYLTQAFVLWYLQQLLQNSKEFREAMGFSIEYIEDVLNLILGEANEVLQYLNYFREKFDSETLEVDPRDWPLVYVVEIARLLIDDRQVLRDTLQEWDNDLITKMEFIRFCVDFFVAQKNQAMRLAKE